jgi:hypothetical protein
MNRDRLFVFAAAVLGGTALILAIALVGTFLLAGAGP